MDNQSASFIIGDFQYPDNPGGSILCAEKKESGKSYSQQTLLLGTHTSEGEQNYLMLAEVQLPFEDTELDARQYDDERGVVGGFGAANGKVSSKLQVSVH